MVFAFPPWVWKVDVVAANTARGEKPVYKGATVSFDHSEVFQAQTFRATCCLATEGAPYFEAEDSDVRMGLSQFNQMVGAGEPNLHMQWTTFAEVA